HSGQLPRSNSVSPAPRAISALHWKNVTQRPKWFRNPGAQPLPPVRRNARTPDGLSVSVPENQRGLLNEKCQTSCCSSNRSNDKLSNVIQKLWRIRRDFLMMLPPLNQRSFTLYFLKTTRRFPCAMYLASSRLKRSCMRCASGHFFEKPT